jgi:hypothetical protein
MSIALLWANPDREIPTLCIRCEPLRFPGYQNRDLGHSSPVQMRRLGVDGFTTLSAKDAEGTGRGVVADCGWPVAGKVAALPVAHIMTIIPIGGVRPEPAILFLVAVALACVGVFA